MWRSPLKVSNLIQTAYWYDKDDYFLLDFRLECKQTLISISQRDSNDTFVNDIKIKKAYVVLQGPGNNMFLFYSYFAI